MTKEMNNERKRLHCNQCRSLTNHDLKGAHRRCFDTEEDGNWIYSEDYVYRMWVCAGCESATLEEVYVWSEEPTKYFSYYPQRNSGQLPIKTYLQLPSNLASTYRECVLSFNTGLRLLCAAGLRALIEGICKSKNVGGRNLEQKIDTLEPLLPKNIVQSLHSFRFMGNDAVHQLEPPDLGDLRIAIEVCEDLMNFLYELDYKASNLPLHERNPHCNPQPPK